MNDTFSHLDSHGKINMVNVGDKITQKRFAKAEGKIFLHEDTIKKISDNEIKKGDVLTTAKIAGIYAAKHTSTVIPLCHNLLLDKINVEIKIAKNHLKVISEVFCTGKTGVEMEALHAVSVSLLTIYDMCKAIDKNMQIGEIVLIEKTKI
jgi:cyclic pyranopterin monophosphate synthase